MWVYPFVFILYNIFFGVYFIYDLFCLTNLNMFVFLNMSCRLEELVDTIIVDVCGKMMYCIYFVYYSENVGLQWKTNMLTLVHRCGELTSFMLEWVRTWLNPQLEDVKSHMTMPYISTLLTQSVEEKGRDGLEIFVDFVHNKYGKLLGLDIITRIVPLSCGKHWSVYIFKDHGWFHFYSMVTASLYSNSKEMIRHWTTVRARQYEQGLSLRMRWS